MANNLRKFNTYDEYSWATLVKPAVSLIAENETVYFNPTTDYKLSFSTIQGNTYNVKCGNGIVTENDILNKTDKENVVYAVIGGCATSIGENAFYDCTNLGSVAISGNITSIGGAAFNNCGSLTGITLPNSVTSIGNSAFYNCGSLASINIPSSITTIGFGAFSYCNSLTSINIPDSVTSIDSWAFGDCSGLTSITVNAIIPPTLGEGAFNNTNDCPIYVPAASVSAYQTAWSDYASRIVVNSEWTTINIGEVPPSTSKVRIADNVTLQEGHNATFGTVPVDTWALQYDNGTWYNFRLFENGNFVASQYQLTSQDGYYIIDFGSVQPFLSCDADSMGQGAVDYATFSFDVYND